MMVVSLGALQSIPGDLYEAASLDGASAWQRFRSITLPLLKPALLPAIILGTIWTFNKFEEIYLLTRGGPGTSTFNLAVYAFEEGMANLRLGVAAATGVVMIALLLVGTIIYVRVSGFGREEKTA
jgi:ABC-type sugar transport system permease subunit